MRKSKRTAPDVVFVTACNFAYLEYSRLLVMSLLSHGRLQEREICVIVFGSGTQCRFLERRLHGEFPGIHVIKANLSQKQFRFLKDVIDERLWALVADYLRGWVANRFDRYIWLDSDILAINNVSALKEKAARANQLSMQPGIQLRHGNTKQGLTLMLEVYLHMYKRCYKGTTGIPLDRYGWPWRMNNAVMIIDRNYAPEWKKCFVKLKKFRTDEFVKTRLRSRQDAWGQGIWNLLYWKFEGVPLEGDFIQWRLGGKNKRALLYDYNVRKDLMLSDAIELGVI
jgi:hypothetical protein